MKHKKIKGKNIRLVLNDILKSLKAKNIIKEYGFWGLMVHKQIRVKLGRIKRDYDVSITYTLTKFAQDLCLNKENCSSSRIDIIFYETTKIDLYSFIKEELLARVNGLLLEESFAETLECLVSNKTIDSFRKSSAKEDRDEDFDWLVNKHNQKFKVNIVSSEKAVIYGKMPDVIYFDLKNSKNPKKDFSETLKKRIQQNSN